MRWKDSLGNTVYPSMNRDAITLDQTAPAFTFASANGNECVTGTLTITSPIDAGI